IVADFVSADSGWLCSPGGSESAHVLFRAGKSHDGYFTNDDIIAQVKKAMDILKKYFPHDKHIFVFDNATTHAKQPPTAPAACNMPKGPSKRFRVKVAVIEDGHVKYGTDGKPMKKIVPMGLGTLLDGSTQSFYGHGPPSPPK
ncbi:hypothetical protein P691DRAFT_623661, partial [Macrolepiota fuliginosa MF-IS2]